MSRFGLARIVFQEFAMRFADLAATAEGERSSRYALTPTLSHRGEGELQWRHRQTVERRRTRTIRPAGGRPKLTL